jgi:monoamine oxidase
MSGEAFTAEAVATVAVLFSVPPKQVSQLLQAAHTYDWRADPFTRGAYSYTPVRMSRMARHLAAPVADTLFFAGEATNDEGDQGTVHGALTTGLRAAREVIESWPKPAEAARKVQSHA